MIADSPPAVVSLQCVAPSGVRAIITGRGTVVTKEALDSMTVLVSVKAENVFEFDRAVSDLYTLSSVEIKYGSNGYETTINRNTGEFAMTRIVPFGRSSVVVAVWKGACTPIAPVNLPEPLF